MLAALLALLACSTPSTSSTDSPGGPDDTGTPAEPTYTWHRDVEPVLQRSCVRCHDGAGVGPGDWSAYEEAAEAAARIAAWTGGGLMPPGAADPECRDYVGAEQMHISEAEREMLATWASEEAPLGDPKEAPPPVDWSSTLEGADVRVTMPGPYTVSPGEDGNDYRCFVVEYDDAEAFFVTGFDVDVENPEVVHHMVLFKDPGHDAGSAYGGVGADGRFSCRDPIMESDWELLHAWAPGMPPTTFVDGAGMKVEAGAQLVLQMHYFQQEGEPLSDESAYLLRTEPSVDSPLYMVPIGPTSFTIPAGAEAHEEHYSLTNTYVNLTVHGVFPHMHWLGTSYEAQMVESDGTESCLIASDRWDFDNQVTYMFPEPIPFDKGTTLKMSCTWDNSAANPSQYHDPPQDVRWGEGTNEEMCFFLTYVGPS